MRKMAHVKTLDTLEQYFTNVGNIASHLSPLKYIRQIKTQYIDSENLVYFFSKRGCKKRGLRAYMSRDFETFFRVKSPNV